MVAMPWPKTGIIKDMRRFPMKTCNLLIILYFLGLQPTHSQVNLRNILKDPAVSLRCKELISERKEKIEVKQKTQFLLRRSVGIQENAPNEKKSIKRKMRVTAAKLKKKLYIVEKQIERMEKNIVRTGCPGLVL